MCYTYPKAKQGIPEARGQGRGPSSCNLGAEEPEEQTRVRMNKPVPRLQEAQTSAQHARSAE